MFKEFKISANDCKKLVCLGGLYLQILVWFSEITNN